MFSYYGIAASVTIGVINYVLLGFEFPVDNFYMPSFEIWLATTVVFFGSGNVGFTILEYRLGEKSLLHGLLINLMWIPFLCVIVLVTLSLIPNAHIVPTASSSSVAFRSPCRLPSSPTPSLTT